MLISSLIEISEIVFNRSRYYAMDWLEYQIPILQVSDFLASPF